MTAAPAPDSAVALSGEAFTVLAVMFVAGMLLVALLRARAKSRSARRLSPRSGRDDGHGGYAGDSGPLDRTARDDHDGGAGDGGDGGGGGGD